jgi:phage gp29-like protein
MKKEQEKETKKKGKSLIGLLETRQNHYSTQSIDRWKRAIRMFESPTQPLRYELYDMYKDILLDGHVEACWGKRRDSVLNRRLSLVRDGVVDEEINKLLNSADMREFVGALVDTVLYGYTLIQINGIRYDDEQEQYRIDFDLIPRNHVHPEPGFECVSREQTSVTADFRYMEPPLSRYMIWAGDPLDKGLFVKVVPYVIYKRGGFGDWAQFSEMFGMPFREAIYDSYDEETRTRLEQLMQKWSASMYLVHQRDVELKLHATGGSTQSSEVYERLIQVCNAGISKTILGNTLTTEQGDNGARSLGEVHEAEEDAKKASDERFLLSVLNTQFRTALKHFGINVTGGEILFEYPEKDWHALQAKWAVVSSISAQVPVSDDYIYEEFDIPKPDNYEELKEEQRLERHAGVYLSPGTSPQGRGEDSPGTSHGKGAKNWLSRAIDFFG